MKLFLANIFSIICVGLATYLIVNDLGHWGWFIFLALINLHSYSNKGENK